MDHWWEGGILAFFSTRHATLFCFYGRRIEFAPRCTALPFLLFIRPPVLLDRETDFFWFFVWYATEGSDFFFF